MSTKDNKYLAQMANDIQAARQNASFSSNDMQYLLHGGKQAIKDLNDVRALAEKEPLFTKANIPFQSRTEVSHTHYCPI
jgi:hypothetical protein